MIDSLVTLAPSDLTAPQLSWPVRVLVTDTNYLASTACHLARRPDVVCQLEQAVAGGRAHVFIASHVPHEMPRAIANVAAAHGEEIRAAAWRTWLEVLAPLVRVVDLPIREHLDPQVHDVRRNALTKGGDPDDGPTAALASFLAPAVLLSEDSVFGRAGMAVPVSVPVGVKAAARVTRGELAALGGAHASLIAGRIACATTRAVTAPALAHPTAALTLILTASVAGWAFEAHRPGSTRAALSRASTARGVLFRLVGRGLQVLADAHEKHQDEWEAAVAVLSRDPQSVEEAAAAVLARAPEGMSIAELHGEISQPRAWSSVAVPHDVSQEALTTLLRRHDAFVEAGQAWTLGRAAS